MKVAEAIEKAMEVAGYVRLRGFDYRFSSQGEVLHSVHHRFWGHNRFLSTSFAFSVEGADLYVVSATRDLLPQDVVLRLEFPLVRFSLGRWLNWGTRGAIDLQNMSGVLLTQTLVDACKDHLLPLREKTLTRQHLFLALSGDISPLGWRECNPQFRAAVLAFLAKDIGGVGCELRRVFTEHRDSMNIGWPSEIVSVDQYLQRLLEYVDTDNRG